jgi:tyrosyl-tRNA synthetase
LHGRECLSGIHDTVNGMFGGEGGGDGIGTEGLTRTEVYEVDVSPGCGGSGGIKIVDLLVRLGLASSKKDAKRLIAGGGAKLGEDKIVDEDAILTIDAFTNGSREITLRAGKKRAGVVELK